MHDSDNTFAELLGLKPNEVIAREYILMGIDTFIENVKNGLITDNGGWAEWATETHHQNSHVTHYGSDGLPTGGSTDGIDLIALANGKIKPPHWATHVLWLVWR